MTDTYKPVDAIQLLVADHRKVEDLFEKFEKTRGAAPKQRLVAEICNELKVHAMIEEEIFYPALRGKVDEDMLDEAFVEHDGAKVLINDLSAGEADEDYYDAKVKVLKEQIEHHVREEERMNGSLFSQARKAEIDLARLGEEMRARKEDLMATAEAGGLPPADTSAVDLGRSAEVR